MVGINWKHYSALAIETMACYAGLTSLLVIQQIFIERQLCDAHKPRVLESIRVCKRQIPALCIRMYCVLYSSQISAYLLPKHPSPQGAVGVTIVIPQAQKAGLCHYWSGDPAEVVRGRGCLSALFLLRGSVGEGKDAGKGLPQSPPPSKECTASSFPSYFPDHLYRNPIPWLTCHSVFGFCHHPVSSSDLTFFLDFGGLCSLSLEFNFD